MEAKTVPRTRLVGNFPNPFNPRTTVSFHVGQRQRVTVSVYDLAGRELAVLADQVFEPGPQEVVWDGLDSKGMAVASGSYFIWMKSSGGADQKKVILVR